MARIRGRDLQRCLVVPVDVGKSTAMALVADHYGEVVVQPFEFPLTEPGFAVLASAIARSEAARSAEMLRVGVESAGHYHRTLVARLRSGGYEVVELNPAAVKESRAQQLVARLKSDARDLDEVHRFLREGTDDKGLPTLVADTDYAGLSLAMRQGGDPDAVTARLIERGAVVVHASQQAAIGAIAERITPHGGPGQVWR